MDDSILKLRKEYFSIRDAFVKAGYTKAHPAKVHRFFVNFGFKKLIERDDIDDLFNTENIDPDCFLENYDFANQMSTHWLTQKGWVAFIEEVRNMIFNTYKITL